MERGEMAVKEAMTRRIERFLRCDTPAANRQSNIIGDVLPWPCLYLRHDPARASDIRHDFARPSPPNTQKFLPAYYYEAASTGPPFPRLADFSPFKHDFKIAGFHCFRPRPATEDQQNYRRSSGFLISYDELDRAKTCRSGMRLLGTR